MAPINGTPMIGHVYRRVARNSLLQATVVATCDPVIAGYISSIGGHAVMTSDRHERASDRCAEALEKVEQQNNRRYDIVVMVQGDEPMIEADMITEAVAPMIRDPKIKVVNLRAPIRTEEEWCDKNCIKVVCDRSDNALFFSRQPIPTSGLTQSGRVWKQVCVIPFRRDFLIEYGNMAATPLEIAESVDMMRLLEHGFAVRMVDTVYHTQSVDTPADLARVQKLMAEGLAGG